MYIPKTISGFSLIEFLVYLCIVAQLCIISSSSLGIVTVLKRWGAIHNTSLMIAEHMLIRDCMQAPADKEQWKHIMPHKLIWRKGKNDISWELRKHRLVRKEGTYDQHAQQWLNVNAAIALDHLKEVKFEIHEKNNEICAITYILTKKVGIQEKTNTQRIALRNRILV